MGVAAQQLCRGTSYNWGLTFKEAQQLKDAVSFRVDYAWVDLVVALLRFCLDPQGCIPLSDVNADYIPFTRFRRGSELDNIREAVADYDYWCGMEEAPSDDEGTLGWHATVTHPDVLRGRNPYAPPPLPPRPNRRPPPRPTSPARE